MIIRWEDDDDLRRIITDNRLPNAVADILRAHRKGHHLLVMKREVAIILRDLDLSAADKALVSRLASEYTQTGSLHTQSSAYLSVKNSLDAVVNREGNKISVSLGVISETRILDPSIMLVENISRDGWFFEQLIAVAAIRLRLGAYKLELAHGGGDDIASVFDVILRQKRTVMTIIDSDRSAPMSSDSAKVARLIKTLQNSHWTVAAVEVTPCREIENLVPLGVLASLPSGVGCETTPLLMKVDEAEDRALIPTADRLANFFDFKLGFSSARFAKLKKEERDWFSEKLALAGIQDDEWTIPGYGEKVINQIKAEGRHISNLRSSLASREWTSRFLPFVSRLLWYFVASRRLVT